MKILPALRIVFEQDGKIRRDVWEDKQVYVSMHPNETGIPTLSIYLEDKKHHPLILSDGDIEADDWHIMIHSVNPNGEADGS